MRGNEEPGGASREGGAAAPPHWPAHPPPTERHIWFRFALPWLVEVALLPLPRFEKH